MAAFGVPPVGRKSEIDLLLSEAVTLKSKIVTNFSTASEIKKNIETDESWKCLSGMEPALTAAATALRASLNDFGKNILIISDLKKLKESANERDIREFNTKCKAKDMELQKNIQAIVNMKMAKDDTAAARPPMKKVTKRLKKRKSEK